MLCIKTNKLAAVCKMTSASSVRTYDMRVVRRIHEDHSTTHRPAQQWTYTSTKHCMYSARVCVHYVHFVHKLWPSQIKLKLWGVSFIKPSCDLSKCHSDSNSTSNSSWPLCLHTDLIFLGLGLVSPQSQTIFTTSRQTVSALDCISRWQKDNNI